MPENTTNEQYRNIRVALHYFTPEFCAALLERNTRNRRENPHAAHRPDRLGLLLRAVSRHATRPDTRQ